MTDKILHLCRKSLEHGDRVVMAVSGGADSMCLAHALHRVAGDCGAKIFLAHVNHQLRGEEADGDARFVCAWPGSTISRALSPGLISGARGAVSENVARQQRTGR